MAYKPGVRENSITGIAQPSKIALYFAHRVKHSVKPSAGSMYNWDPLLANKASEPATPKDISVEPSQIAFYFADVNQEDTKPSQVSIQHALELRIAELSKELESSRRVAGEWKARALTYHAMKMDWDLSYEALHKSVQKDLVEIESDISHLANSVFYLNAYEKRTHEGVRQEVEKFMSLINSELSTTEQVNEVSAGSAECIRKIAGHIGPLLMEFNKMFEENRRTTPEESDSTAERKRILNTIVNRDISTVLIYSLNSLKQEILAFFDRRGLQKLRMKPHDIVKYNDFEDKLACIKIRLALYTGQYEEAISQIIEKHQTEMIQECKKGAKRLVDAKIVLDSE